MFPKQVDNIYIKEAYGKLVGFYTVGVSLPWYKPVLSPP
jgi:hypothetical protein